ncbi:MAG: glycosyltransferase, partial [Propionibacteriaceae bacterium]|nr:glycosyltransferase [Propionibacteriaceae bacterium]
MRVSILTREYPPYIYGGAGVHVGQLVPQLRKLVECVDVQAMGEPRPDATSHPETFPPGANQALRVLGTDVAMANAIPTDTDIIHSHTWYANFAGLVGSKYLDVPHVVTAHSLEPHRPWKAEQLGGGYRVSSWAEKTAFLDAAAVISVSSGMRADVLKSYGELDPDRVHVVR